MEGLKGLIKKPWFWIAIAGVALVAIVMSRKRGATAGGAVSDQNQAYRIAGQGMASSAADQGNLVDQFMQSMQMKSLSQQSQLSDVQFQQSLAEQSLYSKLYGTLSGKGGKIPGGVKCPAGKARIDPSTGQIYCREKQGGGFFSGINFKDLLNTAETIYTHIPQRSTTRYTNPLSSSYQSTRPGSFG